MLDQLNQLQDDIIGILSEVADLQALAGFEEGARTLAAWLCAAKNPEAALEPSIFEALVWAEGAFHYAWCLAESLRMASGRV